VGSEDDRGSSIPVTQLRRSVVSFFIGGDKRAVLVKRAQCLCEDNLFDCIRVQYLGLDVIGGPYAGQDRATWALLWFVLLPWFPQ